MPRLRAPKQQSQEKVEFDIWFKESNEEIRNILPKPQSMPSNGPAVKIEAHFQAPKRIRVYVYNSYEIKDSLKADGYRFDSLNKAWIKDHNSISEAIEDAKSIGIPIYANS